MITRRKDIATFEETRQFIEKNFTRDIPVALICREFGLNRTKLQEGFNQLFGISVHAFISQERMKKARALLTETDESVKVIAIECGYKSISSFTRSFTRLHKMSPMQYRSLSFPNRKPSDKLTGSDN
ncbi:MAG TPA: AraC family transcriptional regulator [Puia sp.]|nr:AraC family transcriptional regulator [Puia sp.]